MNQNDKPDKRNKRSRRPDSKTRGAPSKGLSPSSVPQTARQREIVDVAAQVFSQQGYAHSSVQDVAAALGIHKGSLYHYIDTKEDLLFHVISEVHGGALPFIHEVRKTQGPPIDRLHLYIRRHVEYNARNFMKVVVYYHDFDLLSPDRRRELAKQRVQWEQLVTELLVEARDTGEIHPELDLKLATNFIFGAVIWIYTWYRPGGRVTPKQLGLLWADLLIRSFPRLDE